MDPIILPKMLLHAALASTLGALIICYLSPAYACTVHEDSMVHVCVKTRSAVGFFFGFAFIFGGCASGIAVGWMLFLQPAKETEKRLDIMGTARGRGDRKLRRGLNKFHRLLQEEKDRMKAEKGISRR